MDARSVPKSINKSWWIVYQLGLGASYVTAASLTVSETFRDLSMAHDTRYEEIYSKGLELVAYNFLLTDNSYFQFSALGGSDVRYAFYPNPFIEAEAGENTLDRLSWLVKLGDLTYEEYLTIISDHHVANRFPMFRYEHSAEEYRAFHHPCAHLHIGHPPRGRWCVTRALTPAAFTMLVLKHHYPEQWQSVGIDSRDADTGNSFETALLKERAALEEIELSLLSAKEKKTFRID